MAEQRNTKSFSVFDCDSHIVEPKEIWEEYVPKAKQGYVKSHFYNPLGSDVRILNGTVRPSQRNSTNNSWQPGRSSAENKKRLGAGRGLVPGTSEYDTQLGQVAAVHDPHARLKDMDAMGIDQVMIFPSHLVSSALLRDAEAACILFRAYNEWAYDYCQADPRRLFPCALLPLQSPEGAIEELRRVAKKGFKAVAVRPVLWDGRYPTFPEFDPLWHELEQLGLVLGMHTFPSSQPLTEDLAQRMRSGMAATVKAAAAGERPLPLMSGSGWQDVVVYSPGQMVANVVNSMGVPIDANEAIGFIQEAMTWITIVLHTGWLEKFPTMRAAILESNASWLPLVLEKVETFLDLQASQRGQIGDPHEIFYRQCFIAFEGDEEILYRLWDIFENIAIWSSDYPHHDAADAWEAIERMNKWGVPEQVQAKLMGGNARRMYGIEPALAVTEAPAEYRPELMPTAGRT